jgi:HK97 family phage prohead protease
MTNTLDWRRKKSAELRGLERREGAAAPPLALRDKDADTWTLTGFACVTGTWYPVSFYAELIEPGAFKRTLGEQPDVQLLINHTGMPLARTSSGTMSLEERTTPDASGRTGLWVDADLDKLDPDAQSLWRKMKRGDIDQMSFAFQVTTPGGGWNQDFTKRRIGAVSIHRGDVSVVNQGANPATLATIRAAELGATPPPLELPDYSARAREVLALLRAGPSHVQRSSAPAPPGGPPDHYTTREREFLAELRRGKTT